MREGDAFESVYDEFAWSKSASFEEAQDLITQNPQAISIEDFYLESDEVENLLENMASCKTIKALRFRKCDLHVTSATLFASMYLYRRIIYLNIASNNIWDDDLQEFSPFLAQNLLLRYLNLSCNHIGDPGVEALGKSLATNTALTVLNLAANKIMLEVESSRKEFAAAISSNQTLTHLDLCNNKIEEKGALALATALSKNITLSFVDVSENPVGSDGAIKLQELVGDDVYYVGPPVKNSEFALEKFSRTVRQKIANITNITSSATSKTKMTHQQALKRAKNRASLYDDLHTLTL